MEHNTSLTLQERLSALADGELSADDIGPLLDAMEAEPALYEAWALHHALAASVRGERVDAPAGDWAFWHSLQKRLDQECEPLHALSEAPVAPPALSAAAPASNEAFWKVRALASLALVFAVAGLAAVLWPQDKPSELFARGETPVAPVVFTASSDGNVILRNPELDALMAAHQQMGGHSAWQVPSGFLRNATFESTGP